MAYPSARFALQPRDFVELGDMILRDARFVSLPRIVVQEGGYLLSDVPDAVAAFLVGK